ncbi:MAG: TlpA disulfide reductase family protein [Ferruginibacter sp.]
MRAGFLLIAVFNYFFVAAQQGNWSAFLEREDGNKIAFTFDWKTEKGKPTWYINNAVEKIKVDNIVAAGDSFVVQMPVFESQFRFILRGDTINGTWIKKGALKTMVIPFTAARGGKRFIPSGIAEKNVSGRWAVTFSGNQGNQLSVAEFVQKGSLLTGTFLNATGDYRYLEGIVTKDTLLLSAFDGSHAFLFKAKIKNDTAIADGMFYSGATGKEQWTAVKNDKATLPTESVAMYLKPGEERLDFAFKDLDGKLVAINSERFKNKVTIVQLMGTWCPNCMDETVFLNDYYKINKQRGVEVVSLAYEYTTNWERSVSNLKKFKQRFDVRYTILNTEVSVVDSLRTEKTIPQVTKIKFFLLRSLLIRKAKYENLIQVSMARQPVRIISLIKKNLMKPLTNF